MVEGSSNGFAIFLSFLLMVLYSFEDLLHSVSAKYYLIVTVENDWNRRGYGLGGWLGK